MPCHPASTAGNVESHDADPHPTASSTETPETRQEARNDALATAATVAVVGVGAVIFEAALLPGLVLGVAAALAPKYLPKVGTALNPLFKSTVRGVYKLGRKSREAFSEAQEHVHDIVAEVNAESDAKAAAPSELKDTPSVS